jgi:hypothetical protein
MTGIQLHGAACDTARRGAQLQVIFLCVDV